MLSLAMQAVSSDSQPNKVSATISINPVLDQGRSLAIGTALRERLTDVSEREKKNQVVVRGSSSLAEPDLPDAIETFLVEKGMCCGRVRCMPALPRNLGIRNQPSYCWASVVAHETIASLDSWLNSLPNASHAVMDSSSEPVAFHPKTSSLSETFKNLARDCRLLTLGSVPRNQLLTVFSVTSSAAASSTGFSGRVVNIFCSCAPKTGLTFLIFSPKKSRR